jgi:hypothetical protein
MEIHVKYDGAYPNLCAGSLQVTIGKKVWNFPKYCMQSGGNVGFTKERDEIVTCGDWSITEFPEGFPEKYESAVVDAVNEQVQHGCCGGCV